MNAPLKVQALGLEFVLERLRAMQQRANDIRPALGEIGVEFAERIRQQFSQGRSPYGEKWAALSKTTQARNNGKRTGGQPLMDTGRLRASIDSSVTSASSVSVGTNLRYAGLHQYGARQGQYGRTKRNSPIPWGNVPARPYMPIQSGRVVLPLAWSNAANEIVADHIKGAA